VKASQQASSRTRMSRSSTRADSTARMTIIFVSVRPHIVHACEPAAPPACAAALGVDPPALPVPVTPDVTWPVVCVACRVAVDDVTESDALVAADVMANDVTEVVSG